MMALAVIAIAAAGGIYAAAKGQSVNALMAADPQTILIDPVLRQTALPLGQDVFEHRCATCHGAAGKPDQKLGVPDLTDGDWLYGKGEVSEIEQTVLHGIRSGDSRGWNLAYMPAYARSRPYASEPIMPLMPSEITDVAGYLHSLPDPVGLDPQVIARGRAVYAGKGGCWDCHGATAGGDAAIGAPNLADEVWLYGDGSQVSIARTISYGRFGRMPAFAKTLTAVEARAVAVYVAALSRTELKGH
ncbi:MAG: c-type cytochrome [Sphingomonadales bacterium]|nr:c-type cytochrome [Sphingomonadales bacterium]